MIKRISGLGAALFCSLIVSIPQLAAAAGGNLLKDPGFEQKLSAEQGGWIVFDQGWISRDQARSGEQSMYNWGFSRTLPTPPFLLGTVSGSFQEFPAAPGSRWRMTGAGITPTVLQGAPAFGVVQVSFFDSNGNDLGTVETAGGSKPRAKLSNEINAASPAGEWIELDTGVATAPDGAASVQAFTLFVDYSGSDRAQGVFFDDVKLCAVDGAGC